MTDADADARAALEASAAQIRSCILCRLHRTRANAVPGEGPVRPRVLLLGEAPGKDEDLSGRPFVGRAGRILDKALAAAGLARDAVFITNVVKCRPPGNRTPKTGEIDACRPYLLAQLDAVRPDAIVTLGSTALLALLGPGMELKAVRGKRLEFRGTPTFATYHPAAILYNRSLEAALSRDLRKIARRLAPESVRIRSGPPRDGREMRATTSSGGVVHDSRGRILLIKWADEEIWCLPKGTVEAGETLERTAVREIEEETGLRVRLREPVQTVRFQFYWPPDDTNYDKTVTYFLAEPVGGAIRLEKGFDAFRWVTRSEALRLLRWPEDRDVAAKAYEALAAAFIGGRNEAGRGARRSRRRPQ